MLIETTKSGQGTKLGKLYSTINFLQLRIQIFCTPKRGVNYNNRKTDQDRDQNIQPDAGRDKKQNGADPKNAQDDPVIDGPVKDHKWVIVAKVKEQPHRVDHDKEDHAVGVQ